MSCELCARNRNKPSTKRVKAQRFEAALTIAFAFEPRKGRENSVLCEGTILSNCEPPLALFEEGAQRGQIIFAGTQRNLLDVVSAQRV
jgi:hypothetical protein